MDENKIKTYAMELFNAERSHRAIQQITGREPLFDVDCAYAVQMVNVKKAMGMGNVVSGKKIGLTSLAMQRQLGVGEPDFGHLFSAMDCPDGVVRSAELIQPKIEAELAFVLKKDLRGGGLGPADVFKATDYIVAAFEIVDSRIAGWRIALADTVADNASSGRYILSGEKIETAGADLPDIKMELFKLDAPGAGFIKIGEGTGADVMGDPAASVAWLANRLNDYGAALRAGEVILSGALCAAPAAKKGDVFRAEFSFGRNTGDGARVWRVEAKFI